MWVGLPTAYTILGSRFGERVAQWYLARTNIQGQQTDDPLGTDVREGNLFSPPNHDEGAHGPFDDQATGRSLALAVAKHRRSIGTAAAAVAAGGAAAAATARR